MKYYCSIERLLKNANVLQVGTGKNPTSPLYSKAKKSENFLNEKNIKITKRERVFKGFAITYNIEILNYFNPELQLKDTKSAIQNQLKKYCLN